MNAALMRQLARDFNCQAGSVYFITDSVTPSPLGRGYGVRGKRMNESILAANLHMNVAFPLIPAFSLGEKERERTFVII
jgi:hypothetical protein